MKQCNKCGEIKAESEFSICRSANDGLQRTCKICCTKYRADNSEKSKAYQSAYHAAHKAKRNKAAKERYEKNIDTERSRSASYYVNNKDKERERKSNSYKANPQKYNARSKAWAAENPRLVRVHVQNRRARKKNADGKLSRGLAERLFKLQRGKCACCGRQLGNKYHLDHIMPLSLGGANIDSNMQLLRPTCNQQKHALHPMDFMKTRGFLC